MRRLDLDGDPRRLFAPDQCHFGTWHERTKHEKLTKPKPSELPRLIRVTENLIASPLVGGSSILKDPNQLVGTERTQPEFPPCLTDAVLAPAQVPSEQVRDLVVAHAAPVVLYLQTKVSLLRCFFAGRLGGTGSYPLLVGGGGASRRRSSALRFEELGVLGIRRDPPDDIELIPVEFLDVDLDGGQDTDGFAGVLGIHDRRQRKLDQSTLPRIHDDKGGRLSPSARNTLRFTHQGVFHQFSNASVERFPVVVESRNGLVVCKEFCRALLALYLSPLRILGRRRHRRRRFLRAAAALSTVSRHRGYNISRTVSRLLVTLDERLMLVVSEQLDVGSFVFQIRTPNPDFESTR